MAAGDGGLIEVVKFIGDATEVREEMRKTKDEIGKFQKEVNDSGPNAQAKKTANEAEATMRRGAAIGTAIRSSILGLLPQLTLLYAGVQGITSAFEQMRDAIMESAQAMYQLRQTSMSTREMLSQKSAGGTVGQSSESIMQGMMSWSQGTIDLRYGFGPAAQSLRMLGIAAKDAKGELKSISTLMEEVQNRLQKYKPEDRALLARNIFGNTAQAEMVLSGVSIGSQQRTAAFAGLSPTEGAFRGLASLGTTMTLIGHQLSSMLQHLMSVLSPVVNGILTVTTGILAAINHVLRAVGFIVNLIAQNASGGVGMLAGGILGALGLRGLAGMLSGAGLKSMFSSLLRSLGAGVVGALSGGPIGAIVGVLLGGLVGSAVERLFSSKNQQGNKQVTPGQLANMGGFGPNSGGLMGITEYARQTLTAAIMSSNIPYDQLVELRSQTRLLQTIALNSGGLFP